MGRLEINGGKYPRSRETNVRWEIFYINFIQNSVGASRIPGFVIYVILLFSIKLNILF